jgi:type IV pilus assembly protein PilE
MMKLFSRRRTVPRGFTLVELMVTIAVIAILATIVIPTYQLQIRKSRRTEARTALLDAAAREEQYYATHNNYSKAGPDIGYAALPLEVGSGYYELSVGCTPGPTGLCVDYTLTAKAIHSQAKDTQCATLTLIQTGVQGATGTTNPADCWN